MDISKTRQEKIYVVYWVDLDDCCLKKSTIDIVGVYKSKLFAQKLADNITENKEGYCDDFRCHYAYVTEQVIDITDEEFKEYDYEYEIDDEE